MSDVRSNNGTSCLKQSSHISFLSMIRYKNENSMSSLIGPFGSKQRYTLLLLVFGYCKKINCNFSFPTWKYWKSFASGQKFRFLENSKLSRLSCSQVCVQECAPISLPYLDLTILYPGNYELCISIIINW